MKTNIIINREIVIAYVSAILDIIQGGGVTLNDTRNICETLNFLRDNYNGDETVIGLLSKAASYVQARYIKGMVVDLDDDEVVYALISVLAQFKADD